MSMFAPLIKRPVPVPPKAGTPAKRDLVPAPSKLARGSVASLGDSLSSWAAQRSNRPVGEHFEHTLTAALHRPGRPLDVPTRRQMESHLGRGLADVVVHTDALAAHATNSLGARALTSGRHVLFGPNQYRPETSDGRRLLAHELTHVVQQKNARGDEGLPLLIDSGLEREADANSHRADAPTSVHRSAAGTMPNIEEKVLRFGAKWLSKRTVKTVTKHIAKHAREIAGKAIHSVFRSPKKIRGLIEIAIRDATELAAKHPRAVGEVLEEGGVKITRQATGTPGKLRFVVQKVFDQEVGSKGEKVLRIILDQSGRIVTAFPADRLTAIGLAAGGISLLEERTAEAAEQVQAGVRANAAKEGDRPLFEWEDFIPFVGDVWGGSLSEGEDEMLRQEDMIRALVRDIVDEVEFNEKHSLGPNERAELEELVRAGIALPLAFEGQVED